MTRLSILPLEFIELRAELKHHPEIKARLAQAPDSATWLEMLCTELDVAVDGYYMEDDYKQLCIKLHKLLVNRRTILVIR